MAYSFHIPVKYKSGFALAERLWKRDGIDFSLTSLYLVSCYDQGITPEDIRPCHLSLGDFGIVRNSILIALRVDSVNKRLTVSHIKIPPHLLVN